MSRQYKLDGKVKVIEPIFDEDGLNNSMQILCGLGSPDNSIISLELQKKQPQAVKYTGHSGEVTSISDLHKSHFVSTGDDGMVMIWHKSKQLPVSKTQAHKKKINSHAILNNLNTLVTGSDDHSLNVYDISKRELFLKNTLKEQSPVTMVKAFYGNCKFVISCQVTGVIRVWNVDDGEYDIL